MSDVMNPADIEQAIRDTANRIANSVKVCSDAYREFARLDLAYDQAVARAYMAHEGPAHEKKYAAELATANERTARDVADVAYRHADRLAKSLDTELRAYQSVGASIRSMYAVAGRGDS